MTSYKAPVCINCKHRIDDTKKMWCKAFDEIPEIIISGESDHSEPLPEQDNDIVYEPLNEDD